MSGIVLALFLMVAWNAWFFVGMLNELTRVENRLRKLESKDPDQ